MKKIEKYKWENDVEYRYRVDTSDIITNVGKALGEIEKIAKTHRDFSNIRYKLVNEEKILGKLYIPVRYEIANNFLKNCLASYVKASKFLVDGMKKNDAKLTAQAGRYISEGNSWMNITKIRIVEAVEDEKYVGKEKKK